MQKERFKEIIIVDNNSTDKSVSIIKNYPEITLIELKFNSGYTGAANRGIAESSSDLVLVANSDIVLQKSFNSLVIEKYRLFPDTDLLSPLMIRFDRKTIDSAGQTYSKSLYPKEIGYNTPLKEDELYERKIFSVCGAATVFKRSSLEKLKHENQYYDEDFFIFWEDFDIGWRAYNMNMNTIFFPEARVFHYRSGTMKKNFLTKITPALFRTREIKYHLIKNRYLCLIKNFSFKKFWWTIPFIIAKDCIWVTALTITSPLIIIKLRFMPGLIIRAIRKRRYLKCRS